MSQYPQPYVPPNVTAGYAGPIDVLKPARRASLMMLIVGPLMMVCGVCMLAMPMLFPMMPPQQLAQIRDKMKSAANITLENACLWGGIKMLLPGVILLALAFFVRRGGKTSAIIGCSFVGLILAESVLEMLGLFMRPMDPNAAAGLCFSVISVAIFGLMFSWLIFAIRASSSVKSAQQQYMMQYWQYQQNMQAYSGYGYGTPPPISPPPAAEQPPETPPPPSES